MEPRLDVLGNEGRVLEAGMGRFFERGVLRIIYEQRCDWSAVHAPPNQGGSYCPLRPIVKIPDRLSSTGDYFLFKLFYIVHLSPSQNFSMISWVFLKLKLIGFIFLFISSYCCTVIVSYGACTYP